MPTSLEWWTYI